MSKQTGVWLDYREAFIIDPNGEEGGGVQHIVSEVEDYHVWGGARTRQPWGPMDKTSEGKYLERFKHQAKNYFGKIKEVVAEADELYIFGPAEAKNGLEKTLSQDKGFKARLVAVEKADSMTRNQMIARVREFFAAN